MTEGLIAWGGALWLGVLTSISPCPMATNIAAISYIGKRVDRSAAALWTGLFYAAGRTLAYVLLGAGVVLSLFSVPLLSMWFQENMIRVLGPVLVLTGFAVSGMIPLGAGLPGLGQGLMTWLQARADRAGLLGAVLLGFFFALSFCPVSAALFFGSLIPMAIQRQSGLTLPLLYGIGTALPVLAVGVLLAVGGNQVGRALNRMVEFERWARRLTGMLFIGIGLYFTVVYTFVPGGGAGF